MSEQINDELGWHRASGSPEAIGRQLGRLGRDAVQTALVRDALWEEVNSDVHQPRLAVLEHSVRSEFPDIWQELEGLAYGLELPMQQVFAWNCRGDLLASVPDGCTTVQLAEEGRHTIAHNEDGLPFFKGHCFIAQVTPNEGPGFASFCYPGSIPGHTYAVTETGLVQAVNNLRLLGCTPTLPRMVLGRALMKAQTLGEALALIQQHSSCGGFHFTLAQAGDPRLISIEFGNGQHSTRDIKAAAVHANHALHLQSGIQAQAITESSRDRQIRGEQLLSQGTKSPLEILGDTSGEGLPIHRECPDDPDRENTLSTAVITIAKETISWTIYGSDLSDPPVFKGTVPGHS